MNKVKLLKLVLIISVILVFTNFLLIDFDNLANWSINKSAYLGVLGMSLNTLAMFISLKNHKEVK